MRSDVIPGLRPPRPRQEVSRAEESHPPSGAAAEAEESHPPSGAAAAMEPLLSHFFGGPPPVRVQFWDGTVLGPAEGDTLQVRSRDAVRRLLWSPGELGLARAFIVGDLDFDGDIFEVLALLHAGSPSLVRHDSRLPWQAIRAAYRLGAVGGPVAPPPEEAAPRGRLHSPHPRCAGGATPLRREQRLLRHGSRAFNDVLLRVVLVGHRHVGSGSGIEARPHLSQAGPARSGRTANPRCGLRMGQFCHPRSTPLRRGRWSVSPSARSRRGRRGSEWQRPGSIDRSRSGSRTTVTSATGPSTALRRWVCSSMSDPPRAPSTSAPCAD